jgi:hypothetical protein
MGETVEEARQQLAAQLTEYARVTGMSEQRRAWLQSTYEQRNKTVEALNSLTAEWKASTSEARMFRHSFDEWAESTGRDKHQAWQAAQRISDPTVRRIVDGVKLSDSIRDAAKDESMRNIMAATLWKMDEERAQTPPSNSELGGSAPVTPPTTRPHTGRWSPGNPPRESVEAIERMNALLREDQLGSELPAHHEPGGAAPPTPPQPRPVIPTRRR